MLDDRPKSLVPLPSSLVLKDMDELVGHIGEELIQQPHLQLDPGHGGLPL